MRPVAITLVHGTFARDAPWTREGSRLREALNRACGPATVIHAFAWSGENTHDARIRAGGELRDFLHRALAAHPSHRHYVCAHSHGGNVTLYALRDPSLGQRIEGVITLATPFIRAEPRDVRQAVDRSRDALAMLLPMVGVALWLAACVAAAITFGTGASWGAVLAGIPVMGACFYLAAGMKEGRVGAWCDARVARMRARQQAVVARLEPPAAIGCRILCLVPHGDEARGALGTLDRLANGPFWMLKRSQELVAAAREGAETFMEARVETRPVTSGLRVLSDTSFSAVPAFVTVAGGALTVAVAASALAAIAAVAAALLLCASVPRVRRLGYWGEALADALVANISVHPHPPGHHVWTRRHHVRAGARGRGWPLLPPLRHCTIYEDENVLRDVVQWARGQVPANALRSAPPAAPKRFAGMRPRGGAWAEWAAGALIGLVFMAVVVMYALSAF